jgi:prolipoprotein diacylglyceryl transferase
MLSWIVWDPSREMFSWNIPFLERPILWYGFFFALGFFLAYCFLVYLLRRYFTREKAKSLAERALVYAVFGAVIGARLGDVLFYQSWKGLIRDPLSILRIWEGGLASHGGAIGVLLAFFLFCKKLQREKNELPFLVFLDLVCIPIALAAGFIRIGNFWNQEILGECTTVAWAVLFLHPADGSSICPRHPVQLYESFCYVAVFLLLWFLWKKQEALAKPGRLFGLFLLIVFGFRMWIESFKLEQSAHQSIPLLKMGQWLSIPFLLLGLFLFLRSFIKKHHK